MITKLNLPYSIPDIFKIQMKELKGWIKTLDNIRGLKISRDKRVVIYDFWITNQFYPLYLISKFCNMFKKNLYETYSIMYIHFDDSRVLYLTYYSKKDGLVQWSDDYSIETWNTFKEKINQLQNF